VSRIGKKPIPLGKDVKVEIAGGQLAVKGPLGKLARPMIGVNLEVKDGSIMVTPDPHHPKSAAMWGLMRTLADNMVQGVSKGFEKTLMITGTGYKVEATDNGLTLYLGYSKPVVFPLPAEVTAAVENKQTKIVLKSYNKEVLGDTAAKIRRMRPVEPYKGKGVAYEGEKIRRKVGKAGTK